LLSDRQPVTAILIALNDIHIPYLFSSFCGYKQTDDMATMWMVLYTVVKWSFLAPV